MKKCVPNTLYESSKKIVENKDEAGGLVKGLFLLFT